MRYTNNVVQRPRDIETGNFSSISEITVLSLKAFTKIKN